MIYFDHLPLEKDILEALAELTINYVFQPIFYPDGKTIYAYEALMRPTNMKVTELIAEYEKQDKLHVLEVATFFGATQEFQLRGYTELLSMNSFPSEAFTIGEGRVYQDYYGDIVKNNIIEILEYPYTSSKAVTLKKAASVQDGLTIAIDDFGSGINNMDIVDMYQPHIVKLDRLLISDIDSDRFKQKFVQQHINEFHRRGIKVIAEGVERKEEFELLKTYGADFFQGFYLARPA
ncbi:MAG: EAL domain-containing protein [Lachnospiraceae bacterium]|nr:EAL domain-containing protein [Lachnospiraceae bacterium]MBR5177807.1 EAL domain-containing protein [Lachnospiraceae bacterium]